MRVRTNSLFRLSTTLACAAALAACSTTTAGGGGGVYTAVDGGGDAALVGADATTGDAEPGADGAGVDSAAPGSDATAGDTGSGDTNVNFTTADHAAQAQVLNSNGPVLASPTVIPVFYQGDPMQAQVETLATQMSTQPWWGQVVTEYGVGPLQVGTSLMMATAAAKSLSEATVLSTMKANLGAGKSWGAAVSDAVYVFVIPDGTTFTDSSGGVCCNDYDGYHDSQSIGGKEVAYAVVCACANEAGPGVTMAQSFAGAFSHEVVEAATDPYPNVSPAYSDPAPEFTAWSVANGGELADMCEYEPDVNIQPDGFDLPVVRIWSNAAAAAGQDPCVPAPAGVPYFNAMPVTQAAVHIVDNYGTTVVTQGIKANAGQSVVVPVGLFSTAQMSMPITVQFYDFNNYMGSNTLLTGKFDTDTGNNGDTLNLTIHVNKYDPQLGGALFILESTDGTHSHQWTGFVGK